MTLGKNGLIPRADLTTAPRSKVRDAIVQHLLPTASAMLIGSTAAAFLPPASAILEGALITSALLAALKDSAAQPIKTACLLIISPMISAGLSQLVDHALLSACLNAISYSVLLLSTYTAIQRIQQLPLKSVRTVLSTLLFEAGPNRSKPSLASQCALQVALPLTTFAGNLISLSFGNPNEVSLPDTPNLPYWWGMFGALTALGSLLSIEVALLYRDAKSYPSIQRWHQYWHTSVAFLIHATIVTNTLQALSFLMLQTLSVEPAAVYYSLMGLTAAVGLGSFFLFPHQAYAKYSLAFTLGLSEQRDELLTLPPTILDRYYRPEDLQKHSQRLPFCSIKMAKNLLKTGCSVAGGASAQQLFINLISFGFGEGPGLELTKTILIALGATAGLAGGLNKYFNAPLSQYLPICLQQVIKGLAYAHYFLAPAIDALWACTLVFGIKVLTSNDGRGIRDLNSSGELLDATGLLLLGFSIVMTIASMTQRLYLDHTLEQLTHSKHAPQAHSPMRSAETSEFFTATIALAPRTSYNPLFPNATNAVATKARSPQPSDKIGIWI